MRYLKKSHIVRREDSEARRRVMGMNVEKRRGRGRPKKKWLNTIECDMRTADLCIERVGDRVKRRFSTKVVDSK